MLKKGLKLKTFEIKNLFIKKGENKSLTKIERTNNFDIKFYFNNSESLKFSVIAPNKIFKTAVNRNKIRRIFYSVFENYIKNKNKNNTNFSKNIQIVVYPKRDSLNDNFENLEKEVIYLFNKYI